MSASASSSLPPPPPPRRSIFRFLIAATIPRSTMTSSPARERIAAFRRSWMLVSLRGSFPCSDLVTSGPAVAGLAALGDLALDGSLAAHVLQAAGSADPLERAFERHELLVGSVGGNAVAEDQEQFLSALGFPGGITPNDARPGHQIGLSERLDLRPLERHPGDAV